MQGHDDASAANRLRQEALDAAARQDWQAAERSWRRCIADFPAETKPGWYAGQAEALRKLGRHDEADALSAVMRQRWPGNHQGWTGAAQSAAARKDWRAAEQWWRECIDRFPKAAAANWYCLLAGSLEQQGRLVEACDVCRTAQLRFPDAPDGFIAEARVATAQKEWMTAERLWRDCIARFRHTSDVQWLRNLAYTLQQQGRFVDAEQAFSVSESRLRGGANRTAITTEMLLRKELDDRPVAVVPSMKTFGRAPATGAANLCVVVPNRHDSMPRTLAFVRRILEQFDAISVVVGFELSQTLKDRGGHLPAQRIRVVEAHGFGATMPPGFLARVAAAAPRGSFVYFDADLNPARVGHLERFARDAADIQIFGATHRYRLDRQTPLAWSAGAQNIGVDLFHLVAPSNIMVSVELLEHVGKDSEIAPDQLGAAALGACRHLVAHNFAPPFEDADAARRVQSLVRCYHFFLAREPSVSERILDFVANPINCRTFFLDRDWDRTADVLIAQMAEIFKALQRRLRITVPIHFQKDWIDAIASKDRDRVVQIVDNVETDNFPTLNPRQCDFDVAAQPLQAVIARPPRSEQQETRAPTRECGTGLAHDARSDPTTVALDYGMTVEGGFGRHRDGWNFVLQNLLARVPHDPASLGLDAFVDKTFVWEFGSQLGRRNKPWIAITHKPDGIPSFLGWKMRMQFHQSPYFFPHAKSLKALITVEEGHARFLRERFDIPVHAVFHPTNFDVPRWSPGCLDTGDLRLVQVGKWLRRLHSIFLLPKGPYRKCILAPSRERLFSNGAFVAEGLELARCGGASSACYDSVEVLGHLDNAAYDALLQSSIVFLDLFASTANNTVLECIARQTPIVVRRLPATVQYLGNDYPLLFDTLAEAAELAADRSRLLAAHGYLVRWSERPEFRTETFAGEIARIARSVESGT